MLTLQSTGDSVVLLSTPARLSLSCVLAFSFGNVTVPHTSKHCIATYRYVGTSLRWQGWLAGWLATCVTLRGHESMSVSR